MKKIFYKDHIGKYEVPFNKLTKKDIMVYITPGVKCGFKFFEIYFENLGSNVGGGGWCNNYRFSIYEKHNDITPEINNMEAFIDKDELYMYLKRDKAYRITYNYLKTQYNSHIKYKNYIDDAEYIKMHADSFYKRLVSRNHKSIDITNLIKENNE